MKSRGPDVLDRADYIDVRVSAATLPGKYRSGCRAARGQADHPWPGLASRTAWAKAASMIAKTTCDLFVFC